MDVSLASLLRHPTVVRASALCRDADERTLASQIELTSIPAPPFAETARARRMAELLVEAGAVGVRTDQVGNVLGDLPAAIGAAPSGRAPLVLSAHLDTVFGAEVPIEVTRDGDLLRGPGISDDGRGLAVVLAVVRALRETRVPLARPVLVAATVGEEGLGDLRGARHLVGPGGEGHGAAGFISVDGGGLDRVVTRGVGSRRFRVTVRGTGGHSWQDWGIGNPIHALAGAVQQLASSALPADPRTTLTVARWGGGTSINAIPQTAWVEVDARSTSEEELERLEGALRYAVERAVAAESACASGPPLATEFERVGRRAAGATDPEHALVRAAVAATESVGVRPALVASSTDANAAMAEGIPALTMGGGGEAGFAHTTEEWYRNAGGPEGVLRALWTVVGYCGIEP
ncbi:MAG TPA: M20/M25/M40 family metallo-hydrolase [Longimicrobiales bacterium]|nr:M20/M25/M40 family metallo-hydrolase [Longimicrobiales bacterium]